MCEESYAPFQKYYQQGKDYWDAQDYQAAADAFKESTKFKKEEAEAWHQAGLCLLKLERHAEGGMYLRRALIEYQKRIEQGLDKSYNLYQEAKLQAIFQDKEACMATLSKSIELHPEQAELVQQEEEFAAYQEDTDFLEMMAPFLQKSTPIRYQGNKLRKEELNIEQTRNHSVFVLELEKNGWEVEDFQTQLDSETGASPQAFAAYTHNEDLHLSLGYHLDENLIFMELGSRKKEAEMQAYRIYKAQDIEELLAVIIEFQEKVDEHNWTELIEALVDVCDSLLFEMPDGRRVRVA